MFGRKRYSISLLLALVTTFTHAAIPASERAVLLSLYSNTKGDAWTVNGNWGGAVGTECTWFGISCDSQLTHVIQIDLSQNNLVGSIPPLSELPDLQSLSLSINELSGSIPSLSALTQLQNVDLSSNQLVGEIPPLAGLTALQNFDVSNNRLTGSVPSPGALTQLMTFYIDHNQLRGNLPDLSGLASLQDFTADDNMLSGPFPDINGLANLFAFSVSGNQLTGALPALDKLPTLRYLSFGGNQLSGGLAAILQAPQLYEIDANFNQLTGSIPDLSKMTSLYVFRASNNQLSGEIPALTGVRGLQFFEVNNNQLSGNIPALTGLSALKIFEVSNNKLTGPMPNLDDQTALTEIDLDGNQLSGDLPNLENTNLKYARSALCPNAFNQTSNAFADFATGTTPWYGPCASFVNLNQHGLTGAWYNANESGQGFVLEDYPNTSPGHGILAGGWFTFHGGLPVWYEVQGAISEDNPYAELGIYQTTDGLFNAPPILPGQPVGIAKMFFSDCNTALFHYQIGGSAETFEDVIQLTRVDANVTCGMHGDNGNDGSSYLLSGGWYDPSTSGQGFIFDINPLQHNFAATWYTFPDTSVGQLTDTGQRWFSLQAPMAAGSTSLSNVPIYAVTGGMFAAIGPVSVEQVGRADIKLVSCTAVSLTYVFSTGEFSGKTSTIQLQRAGPTPANCKL
jgi:Leucine-rich repeat (LRR) protein